MVYQVGTEFWTIAKFPLPAYQAYQTYLLKCRFFYPFALVSLSCLSRSTAFGLILSILAFWHFSFLYEVYGDSAELSKPKV